jgi:hypothetical protein
MEIFLPEESFEKSAEALFPPELSNQLMDIVSIMWIIDHPESASRKLRVPSMWGGYAEQLAYMGYLTSLQIRDQFSHEGMIKHAARIEMFYEMWDAIKHRTIWQEKPHWYTMRSMVLHREHLCRMSKRYTRKWGSDFPRSRQWPRFGELIKGYRLPPKLSLILKNANL